VSRKLSCRKYRGSFVAEWSGVVRIRKLVEGVDEARNEAKRQTAKARYLSILLDTTRPCTPLHTQEGVAVAFASCAFCVMDRKRNSSSNQGGFKHAPRFLSHAQGERVGSLPAHALLPPRKAHDTWHSAPNHMEPPSAAPRPGLRDAAAIHVCANVYSAERRMGPPTRYYCLCLVSSHPEHQYTGWVGQIMAAASLVPPFWKAHGRHGAGNHPGLSDGLLTD
jgi:hypothetical protein